MHFGGAMFFTDYSMLAPELALEGDGFEPSVPRKTPGVLVVRADFPVAGKSARGEMRRSQKSCSCRAGPRVRISFPPAKRVFELSVPERRTDRERTTSRNSAGSA